MVICGRYMLEFNVSKDMKGEKKCNNDNMRI